MRARREKERERDEETKVERDKREYYYTQWPLHLHPGDEEVLDVCEYSGSLITSQSRTEHNTAYGG